MTASTERDSDHKREVRQPQQPPRLHERERELEKRQEQDKEEDKHEDGHGEARVEQPTIAKALGKELPKGVAGQRCLIEEWRQRHPETIDNVLRMASLDRFAI